MTTISVKAKFTETSWQNIKDFLEHLEQNPCAVVFTVILKGEIEV